MDDADTEIPNGGLFARDGFIEQVGPTDALPSEADEVIDASGMVIIPGLVNTHHHLYQTLTRAVPGAQNAGLVRLAAHPVSDLGAADSRFGTNGHHAWDWPNWRCPAARPPLISSTCGPTVRRSTINSKVPTRSASGSSPREGR